jgi:hypothetical protein
MPAKPAPSRCQAGAKPVLARSVRIPGQLCDLPGRTGWHAGLKAACASRVRPGSDRYRKKGLVREQPRCFGRPGVHSSEGANAMGQAIGPTITRRLAQGGESWQLPPGGEPGGRADTRKRPDGLVPGAGPLKTMAARSIPGLETFESMWGERAPLGWDLANHEPAAKACVALLSDWSPPLRERSCTLTAERMRLAREHASRWRGSAQARRLLAALARHQTGCHLGRFLARRVGGHLTSIENRDDFLCYSVNSTRLRSERTVG